MSISISYLIDCYHGATQRLSTLIDDSHGPDDLIFSSADAKVEALFQEILVANISHEQRITRIDFLIEILKESHDGGTAFSGKLLKCIRSDAAYLNDMTVDTYRSNLNR